MSTRLVPLSPLDHNIVSSLSMTVGYVLSSVDSPALEAAARRMVNKWRLLAGHLEWSKKLFTWSIRVSLEGDVSHRVKFTTRHLHVPLDTPITPVGKGSAKILVRPSTIEFFRHPSTPTSLNAFYSSDAPFFSIHVTKLTNCACVGFSLPHGIFDAFGAGVIIQILDAELHGKPWQPPTSPETNIMQEALRDLAAAPRLYAEEPMPVIHFRNQFVRATLRNMVPYVANVAYEHFRMKHEVKAAYLGEDVVRQLVGRVKEEVKATASGKWVSTSDVLTAWFLKAIFSKENDDGTVSIVEAVSTRSALAEKDPAFQTYLHNAVMGCSMPPLSKKRLASISIASLALLHHQAIASARNVPFIQAYQYLANEIGADAIPVYRRDSELFTLSNQIAARPGDINFGSEMHAFWTWVTWMPEYTNFIFLNKFKGGYMIEARLRSERWDAVAKEVQKLTLEMSSCVRARL